MRSSMLVLVILSACSSAPTRIIVEWTTATEINTAGFNLYRGESEQGPFVKVNDQLIAASPDAVTGGKYRFEDAGVQAGKTYYYQLEDIEYGGASARHGPLIITAPGGVRVTELGLGLGAIGVVGLLVFWLRAKKS